MMRIMKKFGRAFLPAVCAFLLMADTGLAYEINDKLTIGGIVAGIGQYQRISNAPEK